MGFTTDYTAEELAELANLERILDRNMPEFNPDASQGSGNDGDAGPATLPAVLATGRKCIPVRHFFLPPSSSTVTASGTPARHDAFARDAAAKCRQMFRDMNVEIVLRGGQNIRNTRTVTNRILTWSVVYQHASSLVTSGIAGDDGGMKLSDQWMRGLVFYFQERMEVSFAQLNITEQERACVAALVSPLMDRTDFVSHCVNAARSIVTPMMTSSPYFISIIRTCREMVMALKVAQGLLQQLSSTARNSIGVQVAPAGYATANHTENRRATFSLTAFHDDYLAPLREPVWRFRTVLLFLGALELQQSQQQRVTSAAAIAGVNSTATATTVGTVVMSEQYLDYAIHCIAAIVAEMDSQRECVSSGSGNSVRTTLDVVVLGHIKNACLSRFPPSATLALLRGDSVNSTPSGATATAAPVLSGMAVSPLLRQLLIDYPTFIAATVRFAERNEIGDWGRCLTLAQLFCWDITTPPPDAGSSGAARPVIYHTPRIMGGFAVKPTILYAIVREALRPLLTALLPVSAKSAPPAAVAAAAGAAAGGAVDGAVSAVGSAPSGSAHGGGPALPLSDQRLCATLLTVVAWLKGVAFPGSSRMARWAALEVGDQNMLEYNIGEACFKDITSEVLQEVLADALDQVENDCQARGAAAAGAAAPVPPPGAPPLPSVDPTARLAAAVVQYLRRVERVWNALTNHLIELDPLAFDAVLTMGAKPPPAAVVSGGGGGGAAGSSSGASSVPFPAPANTTAPTSNATASAPEPTNTLSGYDTGMLAACKHLFYETVLIVMQRRWPKQYADLLTDPLLHSINVYLLRAESGTLQRSVAAASAGGTAAASAASSFGGASVGAAAGMRPSAPAPGLMKRPRPPPGELSGGALIPQPGGAGGGGALGPVAGPAAMAAVAALVEQETTVVLASVDEFFSALRLVRCIRNRDTFVDRYISTVRERLLTRPAPDVIADTDLEGNKRRHEREAEEFLSSWLSDGSVLKTVRELHTSYAVQTSTSTLQEGATGQAAAAGLKLTTTVTDWRLLDVIVDDSSANGGGDGVNVARGGKSGAVANVAATPYTAAELMARSGQAALMATSATAPLPFPTDLLVGLDKVEQTYADKHTTRVLRWDWANHAFTSFTLLYPKENGRVTTVHGSLLLQRLFLAIAAYGRRGVLLQTLAQRAGVEERRLMAMLKPCLDRDRLLARVGGAGAAAAESGGRAEALILSLNYDYTRPLNRPRGEYTYWPSAERRSRMTPGTAEQDATLTKRRTMIKTSIMQVMKQQQRIRHDDLYVMVRDKNARIFEVSVRNFKQEIEGLIGQSFMTRDLADQNTYVFQA